MKDRKKGPDKRQSSGYVPGDALSQGLLPADSAYPRVERDRYGERLLTVSDQFSVFSSFRVTTEP
ncbi:hypothetical protein M404DRAFT_995582 [Pisolithus tinctorius Marx 270]|uniref:Uncharacterized protein n=1 Tax=Pisolithus tinctorius Marx 270 TaxID=870435 RepID=A0A0C3PA01_PISTI|nr:hypothetical protein M404DRAFT_995582 [Pisolithus tinctorius Marx 270]